MSDLTPLQAIEQESKHCRACGSQRIIIEVKHGIDETPNMITGMIEYRHNGAKTLTLTCEECGNKFTAHRDRFGRIIVK